MASSSNSDQPNNMASSCNSDQPQSRMASNNDLQQAKLDFEDILPYGDLEVDIKIRRRMMGWPGRQFAPLVLHAYHSSSPFRRDWLPEGQL